ncbi:MAG: gamma-glutamyltransferase family protein [Haliea sp.]|nr:MAG: gamma-glutamyltransferase family protein [Haliea sp.]
MKRLLTSFALAALLAACTSTAPSSFNYTAPTQPEGSSGYTEKPGWATTRYSVAAANPLATDAGDQILKAGGSAVDAAIAVQMVLALVEPQSSGIAGGAFLLHYNGKTVEAFDGRETAPAAATAQLFLGADGKPLAFHEAVVGGRSVGTPGAVRMLEMAHKQYGKLPWAQLFEPAIRLSEDGFKVSRRMHTLLLPEVHLKKDPVALAYFYDAGGQPWPVGHLLKNPELAAVLRQISAGGSKALLEGEVAQAIVNKVQQHPTSPGQLSLADLAGYQAKKREPLCHDHAAAGKNYRLCGMPPPSSGAIAIGQILGMLASTPAHTLPPVRSQVDTGIRCVMAPCPSTRDEVLPSADWLHLYTEASRLAYADRAQYVADPDFVQPPGGSWQSLLAPAYLASRAQLIGPQSMKTATAGKPAGAQTSQAPMPDQPEYGTSHISIIDSWGNAIAMTTTIEDAWGSRQMVNRGKGLSGGFLLNNELTDFSFAPSDASGAPIANRVQGGKRPRSSMAPTLVFDKATNQLVMTTGSPGGAVIIHFTTKTLYGVLHWGLNIQQAINLPNFGSLNGPTLLEAGRFPPATAEALRARGHEVREQDMTSGLQGIQRTATGYFGGADPRREGIVMGQ